jgi:DGQHR domain-containing protein
VRAIPIVQGAHTLYAFAAAASVLFDSLSINRRAKNKDEGFQRVLSLSRVDAISKFLTEQKKSIPGAIIVSLDKGKYSAESGELTIPAGTDVGWVIDGQHRLAGAAAAARSKIFPLDVDLPVVAFIGLDQDLQIEQFVTINKEAKNVPTSLYLDLLKHLPRKSAADQTRERVADIANVLRNMQESPFYERIAVIGSPKRGQLSLTNFVRKISAHVAPKTGVLNSFTEPEQLRIISNYYQGLRNVFPAEFDSEESAFFKTVGFGALWNIFPAAFSLSLQHQKGFTVKDVASVFKKIEHLDFSSWMQYGSGDQAERTLGDELRATLHVAFSANENKGASIRL